ncbi:MAG: sulfotransferase family protein [Nitrososphaeraceae archaeon]
MIVFILGAHKSGTTLLRNLFDGHPETITVPFESHFLEHLGLPSQNSLRKQIFTPFDLDNFRSSVKKLFDDYNNNPSKYVDYYSNKKLDYNAFSEKFFIGNNIQETFFNYLKAVLYSLNIEYVDGKVIVEKSVENFEHAVSLSKLFPDAKFIHVIRNPYANFVSLRKFQQNRFLPSFPEIVNTLRLNYHYCLYNSKIINNYYVIKYEDLVLNSCDEIAQLIKFVGIQDNESLFKPTTVGESWGGNSAYDHESDKIDNISIDRWKKSILGIEKYYVNQFLGSYLDHFGYKRINSNFTDFILPGRDERFKTYIRNRAYKLYSHL